MATVESWSGMQKLGELKLRERKREKYRYVRIYDVIEREIDRNGR